MKYISTRGGIEPASFSDVVVEGLAKDGGLTLPVEYPDMSEKLEAMRGMTYQELAFEILQEFIDEGDIPSGDLERIITQTYTREKFQSDDITPVIKPHFSRPMGENEAI